MNTTTLPSTKQKKIHPALLIAAVAAILVLFASLIHTAIGSSVPGADYYTFWVAGRALFLEEVSPYSQEVTEQAQMGILGRLAEFDEDQLGFAYPPYALLVMLPVVLMTFDWAISFWMAFNILLLITGLYLVLPPNSRRFSLTILAMFPVFFSLVLGAFVILISSGIFIFFGLIVKQDRRSIPIQVMAGLLLAWGTVKPQFIWLVLGFVLIYALRERLFPFLVTFFGFLVFLLGTSFLFIPGWPSAWIIRLQEYARYVKSLPTITEYFQLILPPEPALILTGVVFIIGMGISYFLLRRWWKEDLHWLKMLAYLSMVSYLFHPRGLFYEQTIFLLPLVLWLGEKGSWKNLEVLGFWLATLVVSWFPLVLGLGQPVIDRMLIFVNIAWVAWLFSKPRFQL